MKYKKNGTTVQHLKTKKKNVLKIHNLGRDKKSNTPLVALSGETTSRARSP